MEEDAKTYRKETIFRSTKAKERLVCVLLQAEENTISALRGNTLNNSECWRIQIFLLFLF